MPVGVAEHLISKVTSAESVVLDPMAGSGTTLIAARRLGRRSIGFDRDPLALLVSRSVTRSFNSARLERLRLRLFERAKQAACSRELSLPEMRGQLPVEDRKFIRYWFPSSSQKQLFALAAAIEEEPNGPERDLAWVVFSSLIIAKSAGASFALDIPRSRPHKRTDKLVVAPFEAWDRRFTSAVARLPFLNDDRSVESCVRLGDARSLPLQEATVDLVLTSPPYLNAIDYLRAHKFSLLWMGHPLKDLRELRGTMVGTERGLWSLDGLPADLEGHLARLIKEKRRLAMSRRYLSDLRKIMKEMERVLKPDGLALLILGPTIISSKRTDAFEVVSELSQGVGLRVVGSVARPLPDLRRSLPPPSATEEDRLARRMRREIIVALRK